MNKDVQGSLENSCKKCAHPISLHNPNCLFKSEENHDNICGCKDAQYYNTIVSDKHIGWIEIHCNSCGKITLEQFHMNCFFELECVQTRAPHYHELI